ncbi:MAG TPA: 2'-5' RNA ligase family protein [Polyangiaceae bacterium]|nr:2'-5' RNA ligase family protein [Polyangiaceae bacterium]
MRDVWDDLAERGINDFMRRGGGMPHISLAVADHLGPETEAVVHALARSHAPVPLRLSSVGVFAGDSGVVFLGPVMNAELLSVHADLHDRLLAAGYAGWPYYEPGEWVAHCTLTQEMPQERVARAIDTARSIVEFPLVGTLETIHVVEFQPPKVRYFTTLGVR